MFGKGGRNQHILDNVSEKCLEKENTIVCKVFGKGEYLCLKSVWKRRGKTCSVLVSEK